MELEVFKNMERVFNATTQQEQVIAEGSNGYCRGFNSCEEFYLKVDVDAVLAEKDAEIRRLRRALYKACANWASAEIKYWQLDSDVFMLDTMSEKELAWKSMADICRAKAKEYK